MTREDVIRMAREAFGDYALKHVQDFAAFAYDQGVAAEREACAEIAEETAVLYGIDNPDDYDKGCMDCAKAIRARGDV